MSVLLAALLIGTLNQKPGATAQRVVIPFDFESKFDDGRYGQMVGDSIWAKLRREGGFIIPEAMQEVREWCQRNKFQPGPETSLAAMKKAVRDEQAGDLAIWGKIERVEGNETDVYDIWIKVADFSGESPRILHEKKARTKTVSEVPHVYVKEALDALYGRPAAVAVAEAPRGKAIGPNLVLGDFEKGQGRPDGWDPPAKGVSWVKAADDSGSRTVRFQMNEEVAGSTGVLYYSDYFPIEAGAKYRFACRWKTSGCAVKVFIKCYNEMETKYRGKDAGQSGIQKREVYRSQQNLEGPKNTWNQHEQEFTPKHAQFKPRFGRVMLYGYWPAGTVEWDDIVVEKVAPAPGAK